MCDPDPERNDDGLSRDECVCVLFFVAPSASKLCVEMLSTGEIGGGGG